MISRSTVVDPGSRPLRRGERDAADRPFTKLYTAEKRRTPAPLMLHPANDAECNPGASDVRPANTPPTEANPQPRPPWPPPHLDRRRRARRRPDRRRRRDHGVQPGPAASVLAAGTATASWADDSTGPDRRSRRPHGPPPRDRARRHQRAAGQAARRREGRGEGRRADAREGAGGARAGAQAADRADRQPRRDREAARPSRSRSPTRSPSGSRRRSPTPAESPRRPSSAASSNDRSCRPWPGWNGAPPSGPAAGIR